MTSHSSAPVRGDVVIVHGATRPALQPVALVLASRGARVVLTGPRERALGELVGEIVFGGGKARHVVGEIDDPATLANAWTKAEEAFAKPVHVIGLHGDAFVIEEAAERKVPFHAVTDGIFDVPTATRWLDSLSGE